MTRVAFVAAAALVFLASPACAADQVELKNGDQLELALVDDYDNLPAEGRKKNDFKYFLQLGYHL